MKTSVRRLYILLWATASLSAPTPSLAGAAPFYQGKTITIIVGFTPGGGYDSYARALATFMSRHISGNPSIIVQNQPGAGSLVAARSVLVQQPKDGTVLVSFNAGLITQEVVQPRSVNLDLSKFAWVGAPTPDFRVCYGFGPTGVKSWADLMRRKQFVVGSEGRGSGDYVNGKTLRDVFGAPVKLVLGFPGSADARLAIERGELDGGCGSLSSIPTDWLREGKAHVFVRFTSEKPSDMPDTAEYVNDFATTSEQKDLLNFLDAVDEIGRPFAMTKDVPSDRLATLRQAFEETMNDPSFLALAKREGLPIYPVTGGKVAQTVDATRTASPAIILKAEKIYE